jgi:hypothetical protein
LPGSLSLPAFLAFALYIFLLGSAPEKKNRETLKFVFDNESQAHDYDHVGLGCFKSESSRGKVCDQKVQRNCGFHQWQRPYDTSNGNHYLE